MKFSVFSSALALSLVARSLSLSHFPFLSQLGGRGKLQPTDEQRKEIREAFDLFDTDGSGISGNHCFSSAFIASIVVFSTMTCGATYVCLNSDA